MNEIRFWRGFFSVLAVLLALAFFFSIWKITIPFLIGLAIAYLVYPLVDPFVAKGWRQDRVVLVLYTFLLGASVFLIIFFLPSLIHQARTIGQELPSYARTLDAAIAAGNEWIGDVLGHLIGPRAQSLEIPFKANAILDAIIKSVPSNLTNVAHMGLWLFIIPFVSFFALTQGHKWLDALFHWTPAPYIESLLGFLAELNATLGGYIRGLVMESLSIGILTIVGLNLLGVEGAVFLGVVTGIVNIVPFMPVLVGGSLSVLVAIFQGQPTPVLLGIILLFLVVRLFDDFVLIPFVIGHSVRIHPVLMLFSVLAGYQLAGVLGLLLAIPVTAVVKVIVSMLIRNRREQTLVRTHQVHI